MRNHYSPLNRLFMVLSLGMLVLVQSAIAQNRTSKQESKPAPYPWIGQSDLKAEKTDKRNRFSKTFEKTDGTARLFTSTGSLHYQTGNGWENIGVAINPNNTGLHASNPYYNGDNSFKTYYPQHPVNGTLYTRLKEGEISEKLEAVYAEDANGNTVYQFNSNAGAGVQVDGSKITYSNLFPQADLSFTQGSDGRKLDLVINNQQFLNLLPANAQFLVLKEKMTLPNGWTVIENEHGINVYASGKWMANFPQPVATETMSPLKSYENDIDMMVHGEMSKILNGNVLTVITKFPVGWLRQNGRNFPLSLDPTATYYPDNVSMATGNMTGPGATTKTSGNIRLGASGSSSWATFNITTLPPAATITTATMFSLHYSGTGANKMGVYSGMGNVNPISETNTNIYTKLLAGPIYNASDTFGSATANTWYPTPMTGSALTDIATQQSQGWTAIGMLYQSGNTGTMFHYGYNAAVATNKPYLVIDYSTTTCSGTPTAGTPTGPSLACGLPFNLTLSGNSTGTGISFQWQSRLVGGSSWTNLGASQAFPLISTSQTASTEYRCYVTCSGLTDTSVAITVTQDLPTNCYCIPSGPTVGTHYISGFTTTGAATNVNNTGTGYSLTSAGYSNYTNLVVAANPGSTVNYSITFVSPTHYVGVYVDWNQDGDFFDIGDTILYSNVAYNSPFTGSFTVPVSALVGNTRIRIRTSSGSQAPPCGSILNGEAEDYTFTVLGPCTSAGAGTITPATFNICPLTTQVLTASVPVFQLGTSYQWKQSTTSGGPYTNVTGGSGATTLSYTTPALSAGTYYYILETTCANCGPCSVLSNEVTINVANVPAPSGFNSAQCAPGVPTASVVSNAGAIGTGNFNWYSAPTAGTLLQSKPFGPVVSYYTNNFSSTTLTNSAIFGNAVITGGALQMVLNGSVGQNGVFLVRPSIPPHNFDKIMVDFDFTTAGTAAMGEGFSYSLGDDVDSTATNVTTMNSENGTGSKLKLCFVASTNGSSTQGIYLIYNNNTTNEPTPSSTNVIGYSTDVSWKGTSGHVKLFVDSLGKISMWLNTTLIFNQLSIPSGTPLNGYLTTNKSTWKSVFKARTSANTMSVLIDNVDIKISDSITGSPTYLKPISSTTTFYVSELGTNGCLSPRTAVTATVNTPATITATAIPGDSVCTGAPVTLSASGGVTYTWNGNPTLVNGDTTFTTAIAGTFTVTGTDANGCTNTATKTIYLHQVLSGVSSATTSTFCQGGSTTLNATATPLCSGQNISGFSLYYNPANWTFANTLANGTMVTTGAPASLVLNTGTNGSFNQGTTAITRTITCAGTLSFNWSFSHPIDSYADYPQYTINGGAPVYFPGYNFGLYGGSQTGTVSISVNDGDIVSIQVVTIDNDALVGALTMTNFSAPSPKITGTTTIWSAPTGGINLGAPPVTVTPTATGAVTYYVQYTTTTTGCVNLNRQPINLTVNPKPTATVTGGGTVCAGNPLPNVNFTLTGTAPWNLTYNNGTGNITVNGITSSPYVLTNASIGTYTVVSLSDANCIGASFTGSATVVVKALPTATVSGGGTVCAGSTIPNVNFTLTGVAPWTLSYTDGASTYTVNAITSSPYVLTNASAGTYTVVSLSDANCNASSLTGSATVTIIPLPTATVSGGGTVCAGSPLPNVEFALTGTSPWNLTYNNGSNNITVNGITTSPYVIQNAPAGTYTVVGLTGASCAGTTFSGSATVTVLPLPTATVSGGGSVCVGNPLPDVTIALTGTAPWNITYTDGTTPVTVTGINSSPYIISTAPVGSYTVLSVSDINCTGTTSGSANVVVNNLPLVGASANVTNTCINTGVVLNGSGAVSYAWSDGRTDGVPFAISATTTFTVTGTDANACSATSTVNVAVNAASTDLSNASTGNSSSVSGTSSDTDLQPGNSTISYYSGNCNPIAGISNTTALGLTTVVVNVDNAINTYNGQPFVARWFEITPTVNTGATVTFYFTQDDFNDYNTYATANGWPLLPTGPSDAAGIANIRITKNSNAGLGNSPVLLTPASVNWNAAYDYWEVVVATPGFSQFRIHALNPINNAALSATVTRFTGYKTGADNLLEWETGSEQHNAFFQVQHSADGVQFANLLTVDSKAGNGNSSTTLNYQAIHPNVAVGHHYYRLQMVDIDGKVTTHARVIDLYRSADGHQLSVYPNPAGQNLHIDWYSSQPANASINLLDISGRHIQQIVVNVIEGLNQSEVNVGKLSAGVYTLQLIQDGQLIGVQQFRKD